MRPLEIGLLVRDTGAGDFEPARLAPAARLRSIVERAVRAERLGFDSIWLEGGTPGAGGLRAPQVVLAAIAARTTQLRLGAGVTLCLAPDPLRIAEDYATLDGLSSGRIEIVVSDGGFSSPNDEPPSGDEESRSRLRETVELLRRLWTETDVCWSGRYRAPLEHVTVQPRPVQRPHPPIWIGSRSDPQAAALAAELGLPLMLPRGSGPQPAAKVGACSLVLFEDPNGRRESGAVSRDAADVIDRLLTARMALGIDAQLVSFDLDGRADAAATDALERFGRDVLPALRRA